VKAITVVVRTFTVAPLHVAVGVPPSLQLHFPLLSTIASGPNDEQSHWQEECSHSPPELLLSQALDLQPGLSLEQDMSPPLEPDNGFL
jgi:hypothetical protein